MPASGDVLLDTSVVIPYFKGEGAIRTQFHASAKAMVTAVDTSGEKSLEGEDRRDYLPTISI